MFSNSFVPQPENVPACMMAPGTEERRLLKEELDRQIREPVTIPVVINGEEIFTDTRIAVKAPHDHSLNLGETCQADGDLLKKAVNAAMEAKKAWEALPKEHRFAIFRKAADLIEGKYRYRITAAIMLNQSKTPLEGGADAPEELCDMLRYNVHFADTLYSMQPKQVGHYINRVEYRPLEGFVCAITPFNFASIGGNLPAAPAIMGNTVVWKPATTATLACWYIMQAYMEAGIPAGVINFVPSKGSDISQYVIADSRLGGFHFTGSTDVFKSVWKQIGENIDNYRSYPRMVGETGGKDYIFATKHADIRALVTALIRGAFEYQGQKCSAASRAYIPESIWPEVKELLLSEIKTIRVGDIRDFRNFMGAVIDGNSYRNTVKYIEDAKASAEADVLCTGYDDSKGWFIEPTVIEVKNPDYVTMRDELFAPVLSVYVYGDDEYEAMIDHCANASMYALTGAVFSQDRNEIAYLEEKMRHSAGNFNINEKTTGALVGQQPFGGARGSGTDDKAGSMLNLIRWVEPQTVRENMTPPQDYRYVYMDAE